MRPCHLYRVCTGLTQIGKVGQAGAPAASHSPLSSSSCLLLPSSNQVFKAHQNITMNIRYNIWVN